MTRRVNASMVATGLGLLGVVSIVGCTTLMPGFGPPSPGPSPCTITVQQAAPMFSVDAPATASAHATFSLTPWIYLSAGSWGSGDTLIPESFRATVDSAAKTITVTGSIKRINVHPGSQCPVPAIAIIPSAATLSVEASASAGTYTIILPAESFTTDVPPKVGRPDEPERTYPTPAATRSLILQ